MTASLTRRLKTQDRGDIYFYTWGFKKFQQKIKLPSVELNPQH